MTKRRKITKRTRRPATRRPTAGRSRRRSTARKAGRAAIEEFTSLRHEAAASGHSPKPTVEQDPSPNFASRQTEKIQTIVLHNTDGPLAPSLARLKDPKAAVSAHYVVDRTGKIYQLVDDSNTAWHSGNKLINQRSIGIEVVAWKTATSMTTAQERSLIELCKFVLDAYSFPRTQVVSHRSIKATDCPGWLWRTDADLQAWVATNLP